MLYLDPTGNGAAQVQPLCTFHECSALPRLGSPLAWDSKREKAPLRQQPIGLWPKFSGANNRSLGRVIMACLKLRQ